MILAQFEMFKLVFIGDDVQSRGAALFSPERQNCYLILQTECRESSFCTQACLCTFESTRVT